MSQTFYKIWIHLLWSTKNREPSLHEGIRQRVYLHMREKARVEGFHLDTVNGTADHSHCLISLQPKFSISEVVNKLKGESSHWINSEKLTKTHFAWQGGYAAFSVSESQVEKVRKYILDQEVHHRRLSFAEEVQKLLKLYKAETLSDE